MKFKTVFSLFISVLMLLTIVSCGGKERPIVENCPSCQGQKICQICNGKGDCSSCQGSGKCDVCKGDKKCNTCDGSGQIEAKCSKCKGYGFAQAKSDSDEPSPCTYCKATGKDPKGKKAPCPKCVKLTKSFKSRVESGKINVKEYEAHVKGNDFPYIEKALKGISKGTGECLACEGTAMCGTCKGDAKCVICKGTKQCPTCEGNGHKIDFVKCPKCYEVIKYGETKCTKCGAEFDYDKIND